MTSEELLARKVRGVIGDAVRRLRTICEVSAENGRERAAPLTRPYQESLAAQVCADLGLPSQVHPWSESVVKADKRRKP